MAVCWFKQILPLCAAISLSAPLETPASPAHLFSSFVGPVTSNTDGRLEVFGLGPNDAVWNNWQIAPGGSWHVWNDLGPTEARSAPVIARGLNGSLEIFLTGSDHNLWHNRQSSPGGSWSGWASQPGAGVNNLVAAVNADGRTQLFGIGTNASIWSTWQKTAGGEWRPWSDFGGASLGAGFVVGQNVNGTLELFGVAGDSMVWRKHQATPGDDWSEWSRMDGIGFNPHLAIARSAGGHLELFALHGSNIWWNSQITPNADQWTGWADLGGPDLQPGFVVGMNGDGRLEIFGVGENGDVWHLWQSADGSWSDWKDLGGAGMDPQLAVANDADGRLQLFALGQNGDLWHNSQVAAGRIWAGWNDLGGHGTRLFNGQAIRHIPQHTSTLWQTGDGLPANVVTAVTQTRDGYLWVGTQKGLARFDGHRFVYAEVLFPGTPACPITALSEDKNGALWVGTEKDGLFCLTHGRRESWRGTNGLLNDTVKTIYPAADGAVWIGTPAGLNCFEHGRFRAFTKTNGLVDDDIRALGADDDGVIWVGTPRGLNTIQNGAVSAAYTNLNELPDRYGVQNKTVSSLCADGAGGLWIGTANGLVHRRDGNFRDHFRTDNFGLIDNGITVVRRDNKGALWVGAVSGLSCWSRGNACVTLLDNDGSGFAQVNAICEDFEGDIWVGGNDGLRRIKPRVFTTYGRRAGFVRNNVMSVRGDASDALWVAIWGGGLVRFKNGILTPHPIGPVLRTDLILSTCEARDGTIWFGAGHGFGLYSLKQNALKHYGLPVNSPEAGVRVIYEDRQTNLWVAGSELMRMRDGQFSILSTADGLAGNNVQAILEDHQGNVWFGTSAGLSRWNAGKLINFTTRQGLSVNNIKSLYEDAAHTLWIGTLGGGLNRFRDGKFRAYTAKQGLPGDDILAVAEDDHENFWLSSPEGIWRVPKEGWDDFDRGIVASVPCATYGKEDGMASVECNGAAQPAVWKDAHGKLWFPTAKGLVMADPDAAWNSQPPPVAIEEIMADKQAVRGWAVGAKTPLSIQPGRGELEIRYTALSLQDSDKNRFKYKLDGVDADWIDAGNRRVATYANLAPGRYQFHVIACNNDGIWNTTGATMGVLLLPNFWQAGWFFAVGIILGIAILAVVVRQFTSRKLRRELAVLERRHAIDQERSRIARDMHDDLGARLSEVLLLSDMTGKKGGDAEQVRALTGKISGAARDLVDNLDALVWAVDPRHDSLDKFADYIGETCALYLDASGLRCVFDLPPKLPAVPFSSEARHNLFLLIKEALHNVVKHAEATEARLSLRLEENRLILTITDNGRGFNPAAGGNGRSPFGNGLINMEDRMKKIGASFQLASRPGEGTRLIVVLPLPPEAFARVN